MRMQVWCCFLLLLLLHRFADAGREVFLNTTSDNAQYFINDLGVSVKAGTLVFDLTSTQDAIIKLAQKQSLSGSTCDIIFGSVSNTAIAVRESCSGCISLIMAYGTFLDTTTPSAFWLDWTGDTTLLAGEGSVLGESILFTYSWKERFEVNYVTATSYYGNEGQWTFLIDTPPSFISPAPDGSTALSVPEDQPINSTLLALSAQDDEADVVTFYVVGQHSDMFLVQGSDVILKEKLDFETQQGFLVTLVATDGRHNTTATFTLRVTDVIDEAPVVTPGPVTSVPEELAIGTDVVGLFAVEDKDQGDSLTYTLQGSHSSYFTINETSGQITVAQRLDRDTGLSRLDDLWVKVKDGANQVAELSLGLNVDDVNDNKPQFETDVYTVNVTRFTASDVPLLTFNVSDADQGKNGDVSLTLLTPRDGFWISGMELYVNVSQLELSVQPVYTLLVEASDAATEMARLTAVTMVNVQVLLSNEHTPVFQDPVPGSSGWFPELSISEDAAIGTLVLSLSALDDDIGPFGDVTYLMTSALTDNGSNASHTFLLDSASGDLITTRVLDCDLATGGTSFYVLTFQARDTGSRSSEAKLKVTVTNVNDNAPMFSQSVYSVRLSCDRTMGATLTTVTAVDNDITSNMTFALVHNVGCEDFSVNEVTGDVTLESNITEVAAASNPLVLTISVSDGGKPEMTSSAVIVVQMDDCSVSKAVDNDTGVADMRLTNKILTVACGMLGAGFLLSTLLLCIAKANQTTSVKPATQGSVATTETNSWSKQTRLTSVPSCSSTTPRESSDGSEGTFSSSLQSLYLV